MTNPLLTATSNTSTLPQTSLNPAKSKEKELSLGKHLLDVHAEYNQIELQIDQFQRRELKAKIYRIIAMAVVGCVIAGIINSIFESIFPHQGKTLSILGGAYGLITFKGSKETGTALNTELVNITQQIKTFSEQPEDQQIIAKWKSELVTNWMSQLSVTKLAKNTQLDVD